MFGITHRLSSDLKKRGRNATYKPQCEALEKREVLSIMLTGGLGDGTTGTLTGPQLPPGGSGDGTTGTVIASFLPGGGVQGQTTGTILDPPPDPTPAGLALINGLPDPLVRASALADYQSDGSISRKDMLGIFSDASIDYTSLSNTAITSLKTLVDNGPTVLMPDYVQFLGAKVMAATTNTQTFKQNVENFFLGLDRPDGHGSLDDGIYVDGKLVDRYVQVKLPLWNSYPSPRDVEQSHGDHSSWLLTGLEEVAWRKRADIMSMFIDNGDNTYTVRFYSQKDGSPLYVTVDNYLWSGIEELGSASRVLWPALVVKAYAQANAYGGLLPSLDASGANSYKALGELTGDANFTGPAHPGWAWEAITGLRSPEYHGMSQEPIVNAWSEGQYVALLTNDVTHDAAYGRPAFHGADPRLFAAECGNNADCPLANLEPETFNARWYALVNIVNDPAQGELFYVTQDGKRLIEVLGYDALARNFRDFAYTEGSTPPVPQPRMGDADTFASELGVIGIQLQPSSPPALGGPVVRDSNPVAAVVNRPESVLLKIRGRGKTRRLVAVVSFTTGPAREIVSPFQRPQFQGITAALRDLNGDGIFDSVLVTALQGRKKVSRTVML
jgi:hypothetical protein